MTSGRTTRRLCPGKVNLFLRVIDRDEGGYHLIETLFLAIGRFDEVTVRDGGAGIELDVRARDGMGDIGEARSNTVTRAARSFFEATGIRASVQLGLVKRIPAGTGMGGASSDAAGALSALNEHFGQPLSKKALLAIGGRLGADVPFFLSGLPAAWGEGRGDHILPAPSLPAARILVAVLKERSSTGNAYEALSRTLRLPRPSARRRLQGSWEEIAGFAGNDFEPLIARRIPAARRALEAMRGSGAALSGVTGSGSSVFSVWPRDGLASPKPLLDQILLIEGVEWAFIACAPA